MANSTRGVLLYLGLPTLAGFAGYLRAGATAVQALPCPPCRIQLTQASTLVGHRQWPIGNATSIVRDSRGRYYVAGELTKSRIQVFAPDGTFLQVIGRPPDGKGDFGWVGELILASGDTLYAFDVDSGAVSVLSPRLQEVRTLPLRTGFKWDALALRSQGQLIVNMFVGSASAAGHPLHLLDHNGRILSSFGAPSSEIVRRDSKAATFRKLSGSRGDRFWAGRINEYRLDLWTSSGQHVREIVRDPTWFTPWSGANDLTPLQPPLPELVAIHEDRAGLLWLMFNVADSGWKASLRRVLDSEGAGFYTPSDQHAVFDTMIEVLDSTGVLIASQRFPMRLIEFIDDGLAFGYQGESNPANRVDIWRLRVVSP